MCMGARSPSKAGNICRIAARQRLPGGESPRGSSGPYQCKEREQSQTRRSAATPPRNVVVIEGLLLASSHLGLVRAASIFAHVGQHFAIPSRCPVDFQLPLAKLFE